MTSAKKTFAPFLSGGGEMGERIRNFDWSKTPLGQPEEWEQSLKTCVRIMLSSTQPIWIGWGKDLIKLYNDPYKAIVGGKHPYALGSPAAEVWKDIWNDIEPMLKQVMENDTGTYVESQLLIMERYGYKEETYYTFSYTPVLGDDLKPAGMICYNTADTERILNERALQTLRQLDSLIQKKSEQEVYKQTAIALSTNTRDFPFAIIYKVQDNSSAEAIAYAGIDAVSTELPLKIDLEIAEIKARNVATAIRENRIVLSKNDGRWKDLPKGSWDIMPDNYVHIPIKAANKNYPLAVLTLGLNPYRKFDNAYRNFVQQIADQVTLNVNDALAYEEERKRKEALEEIDRAKTIFFTNISHEFRTPLTLMLGTIEEAIKDPETTESNLHKLNVAQRNALRLLKLVNTLLDFSRIESGRQKAHYTLIDISLLTKNLAANFQSIIEKAGLKFTVQAHSIPGDVYVDKQMWEKIVFNLLSNAFKYTLEGSIAVELFAEKNNVVLKIKDTGVGIPEKELAHMFERFHRVQNTVGRTYEGTGIGLSLIKELVQLHGGTISVESKEGEGSVFTVAIPFGKDHLPESQTYNSAGDIEDILPDVYIEEINSLLVEDKISPIDYNNSEQLAPVLVVDDNADMLQHLKSLLQKHYRIITAENGEEALKKIEEQKPLLVLSDIMMPVIDGIQLLKKIKSNIETAHIPVLLLTARAGEESRIEGYEIGADDYLVKPFSAKELLARVRSQIKIANTKRHLQSQLRDFFMEAPASIGVVRGPKHVWEIVNKRMLELSGRERIEDLLGKPIFESVPESRGQGYEQIFDKVYNTGERIILNEARVELIRKGEKERIYAKLLFEPLHEEDGTISGVMFLGDDITEQVEARKKIEESEKELQQLFKEAPVTIVVYSGNNFIVRVANAMALEMWGKTEEEVLNKPFFEISPELEQSQGALLKKILETGEVFTGKELHVEFLRHGTLYSGYFDFVYQPHFNSAREITGIIAIGTEVTHSVIARKKIEESENRFRGMANEAPIFVWLTDENLQTTFLNKTGLTYFGLPATTDFSKLSWKKFIHPEDLDRVLTIMNESSFNQKPYSLELRLRNEEAGEYRWFLDKGVPRYENNTFIGFVGTSLDIHDQKIKEAAKDEFISIAGHELKTPLTSAKAYLQIAQDVIDKNQGNRLQYVEKANKSIEKLSALITELLDISRIQNGKLQLNIARFNFNEMVLSVLESIRPTITKHRIIKTGKVDVEINGDKERMQQLLINLLNNAAKYSPDHDEILLHTELQQDKIIVSVKDHGIGIAKNNLDKVFQRFYRVDETGKKFHGLGIGLYVAEDIIQRHNGKIWVESELGKGSTFYFELPIT